MSCGVALAVALMLSDPNVALAASQPTVAADAPVSVAGEPLFIEITTRSATLKAMAEGWGTSGLIDQDGFFTSPTFNAFKVQAAALSEMDMQGHLILKERGTDNDLKCILRGISEDMPRKVSALEAATTPAQRREALDEMVYLLNDNVEVITSPPHPEV